MTKVKSTIISAGKYVEQLEILDIAVGDAKMVYQVSNKIWQFSINFNMTQQFRS